MVRRPSSLEQFFVLCLSVSGLQEACANAWPATGQEPIDHYDVKCNEVQPYDGYDVIKLEVTSLVRVSFSCYVHVMKIRSAHHIDILTLLYLCNCHENLYVA